MKIVSFIVLISLFHPLGALAEHSINVKVAEDKSVMQLDHSPGGREYLIHHVDGTFRVLGADEGVVEKWGEQKAYGHPPTATPDKKS